LCLAAAAAAAAKKLSSLALFAFACCFILPVPGVFTAPTPPPPPSRKEEDDKKEEDREQNKWFLQMPAFLDWRFIGFNAGDRLAQGIVQGSDKLARGFVQGMVLASSVVALAIVLLARWTEVGNLLATGRQFCFDNKMIMMAANMIMQAIFCAVCLRVAVAILKWVSLDLEWLWSIVVVVVAQFGLMVAHVVAQFGLVMAWVSTVGLEWLWSIVVLSWWPHAVAQFGLVVAHVVAQFGEKETK
jgi:hypothetical protein